MDVILFFDFETTNIRYGTALDQRNRIVMVSWSEDDGPVHTHTGDIMKATRFWAAVDKQDALCAYHIKFEQHWMKRLGFDIDSKRWHDPMLAEKILQGNLQAKFALGDVCERYGFDTKDRLIDSMMKAGVCPSDMPQKRLRKRCERDVRTTRSLHFALMSILKHHDQTHLYRNRCEFATILTHIEAEGMLLDPDRVGVEYAKAVMARSAVKKKLDVVTGGINMNSPDQKAKYLYGTLKFPEIKNARGKAMRNKPSKQFPKGRPKTDKDTLTWLMGKATTEAQRKFVELSKQYSKLQAAVTKNLEFFMGICQEYDEQFHAQFNQTVAATHRLTSSGLPLPFVMFDGKEKSVQFQNMPREFKGCFEAPAGYQIAEVDAMQLEFRVAAFLGQDEQALADIANPNFDAHIYSASEIFGEDYNGLLARYRSGDKQAKALRQAAKPHTFKPLYGGTKGTEGEERYYKKFAERYKGVAAVQQNWLADVMATGEHKTAWNMRFRWNTYMDRRGVCMDKRTHKPVGPQVFNYPVQNLATAEIVPIAIVALYKRCKENELDVKFVNTVHDSVICYVRGNKNTIFAFRKAAEWAFTTAVYEHLSTFYDIEFDVPLGMEMVIGKHWNEGTESIYDDVQNRRKAA